MGREGRGTKYPSTTYSTNTERYTAWEGGEGHEIPVHNLQYKHSVIQEGRGTPNTRPQHTAYGEILNSKRYQVLNSIALFSHC